MKWNQNLEIRNVGSGNEICIKWNLFSFRVRWMNGYVFILNLLEGFTDVGYE